MMGSMILSCFGSDEVNRSADEGIRSAVLKTPTTLGLVWVLELQINLSDDSRLVVV